MHMHLSDNEKQWLESFKEALRREFPEAHARLVIFGSKARGDDGPNSDLDVLVLVSEAGRETKRRIRHLGHVIAVDADAIPSIMVYTTDEWASKERGGSFFYKAVERDGVAA